MEYLPIRISGQKCHTRSVEGSVRGVARYYYNYIIIFDSNISNSIIRIHCNNLSLSSFTFSGKLTPEQARAKFKGFKDAYRRIIAAEHGLSGAARETKKKWKHYEVMEFLRENSSNKRYGFYD